MRKFCTPVGPTTEKSQHSPDPPVTQSRVSELDAAGRCLLMVMDSPDAHHEQPHHWNTLIWEQRAGNQGWSRMRAKKKGASPRQSFDRSFLR
mmetsp:Transcript_28458/g.75135  ORF Transcript_28458/g.75135 Transcript_28458/m.75135 type:complete len:92 (-) Transcript_28458:2394-2669(-)